MNLPNLRTFITSSPFNVLAVLALYPSLLLLGHRHHPLKVTDRSFHYASPCLWNQLSLCPSTSFWYRFLYFRLTYSFTHHFFLFLFTTLHIHTSLSWFFTLGLKPTCFTNPMPPVVSFLPPGLNYNINPSVAISTQQKYLSISTVV